MCFFAILGVAPRERIISQQTSHCVVCGAATTHEAFESRPWFSLFFVPLFPVGAAQTYSRCRNCGLTRTQSTGPYGQSRN
ncbi:MAG: zinc-ribbon domain-containing protein [Armatimonadetes bacterium]|nr:zinc-ribbon domain-containing protein [Armatimonadota bacterium]